MCCLIYKFLLILTQKMQISFLKILPENALKFVSKKMRICVKNFAQLQKNYGKVSMGVVRTTYLIDEQGIIIKANDKVKAADDPEKMLKELE